MRFEYSGRPNGNIHMKRHLINILETYRLQTAFSCMLLSLSKVKRLPVGLCREQVVTQGSVRFIRRCVLLFVDSVSRSCQGSISPARPRRGFQPD